jgi:predicted MPP superfamily phosphohydrolase
MKIFEGLGGAFPVFYAPGNHECKSNFYPEVKKSLIAHGVIVLDNDLTYFSKGKEKIAVLGLIDPTFYGGTNEVKESYIQKANLKLSELMKKVDNNFSILISHRPEIHEIYKANNVDVVFSGHAHGGQWRLPIIGAIYSPGQGLFPEYTSGIHIFNKTKLVISRGMGNSSFPIRLFNRPEVVIVTLNKKN